MTYIDFLKSEYEWCLRQYAILGYAEYMQRAMDLEQRMNDYYECEKLAA